jgi:hypothetical protein
MAKNNFTGRILKGTKTQPSLKGASGVWTLDEALQYHRANQWPQPNLYQPIPNSLRSKASSTSYFYRNTPRPGNRLTWTWSAWFKRSSIGTSTGNRNGLFGAGDSSQTNLFRLYFNATDNLVVQDTQNSTDNIVVVTTQAFRDTNAWYHIVVAIDATQGTSANRVKVYVNGIQVTSFSTATYPTQGYSTMVNGGYYETTGACYNPPTSAYVVLDGYIAEHNFVDGQQLQPTLFGQYDSNNTWVPIPYTGSYGTNGFYLPFTNAQTSQTLGYDASLNGTPTYGADQDPYRGSVVLHLDGNGPAGGQNNTFVDSSTNNLAITRNGSATQGSFSPFPFSTNTAYNPAVHSGSAYFNSTTSDYLAVASNAANSPAGGAFTMECWVYLTGSASGNFGIAMAGTANSNPNAVGFYTSNYSTIYFYDGSTSTSMGSVSTNNWYHLAASRVSTAANSTYLYINGASVSTITLSSTFVSPAPLYIGTSVYGYINNAERFTGYVSNFRLTKGSAIYTSAFTPMMKPFGTLTNNLCTFSEDYTQWGPTGVTVTPNATVAPDGTPTGIQIYAGNGGGTFAFVSPPASQPSGTITFSAYLKAKEITTGSLFLTQGGNNGAVFDLINGVVSSVTGTGNTAGITNAGNGWWRCSVTNTGGTTGSGYRIGPSNGALAVYSFNGSIYAWGAQVEQTSSVGNYVPTPANYSTAPSVLLNFANGSIVDSAGANNIITPGTATISSASKFGQGALTFDGTGGSTNSSSLVINTNSNLIMGTNDFTAEFWLNSTTGNDNYHRIVTSNNGGFGGGTICFRHQSGGSFLFGNTSASITCTLTPGVWYHICYSRKNYTGYAFLNGQLLGTYTDNTNYSEQIQWLGGYYTAGTEQYSGLLDDVRITKGVARYTSSFTPPARALPETGGKSFVTLNVNAGVVKSFTTVGTTSWTAPSDVTQVEVLVVAGGGGGGGGYGGGGGGGGVIYNNQYSVTPGQTYTVTVGAGGAAVGSGTNAGNSGNNSVFGNLTAIGGGGGGSGGGSGKTGGSGGGSSYVTYSGGAGTAGQGFNGGFDPLPDTSSNGNGAGGGGGAGAAGSNSAGNSTDLGGNGGNGLQFGISGTPTYYAGGGGGGTGGYSVSHSGAPSSGGLGGGGVGGVYNAGTGGNATANTGGGGGGGSGGSGGGGASGSGGSGIVLIRYTTTAVANTSDSTTDNLVDSPTLYGHDYGNGGEVVGNYCTLNPLWSNQVNYLNGNLTVTPVTGNAGYCHFISSIAMPSTGYWYAEFTINTLPYPSGSNNMLGVVLSNATANAPPIGTYFGYNTTEYAYLDSGSFRTNNTTSQTASAWAANDVIMVALGNGNVWFGRNGVWQGSGSPNPATATSPAYTGLNGNYQFAGNTYGGGYGGQISANFGQRAWQYTPPQGFSALTTKNFARPTIVQPNQHFAVTSWTGTGATQNISLNFQPDLIWCKRLDSSANYPIIQNTITGITYSSGTNATDQPGNYSAVASVSASGFTLGTTNDSNASGSPYIGYAWRAASSSSSVTTGTITSTVRANPTAGFALVGWTGNGAANATIGHGLGTTPAMIWNKVNNGTDEHRCWHQGLFQGTDSTGYMWNLTSQAAPTYDSQRVTGADSNNFRVVGNTAPYMNATGYNYTAYVWAPVAGFSSFGTYTANASTDGPFVYCGFKPAFVLVKNTSRGSLDTPIIDSVQNTYNPTTYAIFANNSNAQSSTYYIDFLSNGFKFRVGSGSVMNNTAGDVYIYAAFAANPFGNTNGTAR